MVIDPERSSDHARRLSLHRLQSELLILEQDYRKKKRRLETAILERRRLHKEAVRLKAEMGRIDSEETRLKKESDLLEVDIRKVKKKIHSMS